MRIGDKVLVTAAHKVGCGYYGKVVGIFGNIDGRPAVDVLAKLIPVPLLVECIAVMN